MKNILFVVLFFIFFSESFAQQSGLNIEKLSSLSIEELLDITITTAGKKEEKVSEIPASVVVITREDIEKYGYVTLEEIFKNIPGLFIIDDYTSQGPSLGVRGFWDGLFNRNLEILINGVQQTYSYTNTKNFPKLSVPVETIERIEVVRGPMSIFYGSGAFYGVINIFTRDQSGDEESGIIALKVGNDLYQEGVIRYSGGYDDIGFMFTTDISYKRVAGPDISLNESRSLGFPEYWNIDENAPIDDVGENGQFVFDFSGKYRNLDLIVRYTNYFDEGYFLFPSWSGGKGTDNKNSATNIYAKYNVPISDKLYADVKMGYYSELQRTQFSFFDENFYGLQFDGCSSIDAEVNVFYNPTEKLKTTFGIYHHAIVDFYKTFDLPSFLDSSLENNTEHLEDNLISNYAFFTQIEYNLLPKLKFVGGLRLEKLGAYSFGIEQIFIEESIVEDRIVKTPRYTKLSGNYEGSKWEIIPRAAILYSFNENNVIKFLYGKAINQPSLFQNIKNINIPDNELKAEELSTIELNYSTNQIEGLYFSFSAFRNELDNLITRVTTVDEDGNNYATFNANAGKMLTNGIELSVRWELTDLTGFEISATAQHTEDKYPGMQDINPAYSPQWLGYFKAFYLPAKNVMFSATANYVDRMDTYWDNRPVSIANRILDPIGRIGEGSSSYVDVGANLRISDLVVKGGYINLKCSNLLDTKIHYPTFTNNTWANVGTFGNGRSFYLSVGYKF